ncbi:MAG: FGGY-family carbohydrate kinase [Anaerolineae bacterium]
MVSLVGVDIGISDCRVLAISHDGRPLAQARASYTPESAGSGDLTLDPGAVWDAVGGAIAEAIRRTHSDRPLAICIASTPTAVTPLDAEGGLLGPALLCGSPLSDENASGGFDGLTSDEVVNALGDRPAALSPLRALFHWRRDQPSLYARMWRAVPLATLVGLRLGGACVVDASMGAGMQLLDVASRTWSGKVLRVVHMTDAKLPEILAAGSPIGTVSPSVAGALGIAQDVRIVLGGADYACAALALGVLHPSMGLLSLDRVISILAAYEAPPLVGLLYARGLNAVPHVVANRWLTEALTPAGGNVLRWLRDAWMAPEAREAAAHGYDFYRRLMDEMPGDPTGIVALPPHEKVLSGHGQTRRLGGLWGITTTSSRGEVVKAFLEGAMLASAESVGSLREAGVGLRALRATGPGARSEPWLQLAADVMGITIEETGVLYPTPLGAAMLAGIGAGVYSNARDAADTIVRVQRRYEPRPSHHDAYVALRERYRAVRDALAAFDESL